MREISTPRQKVELLNLLAKLNHLDVLPWVHAHTEDAKEALHSGAVLASDSLGTLRQWATRWSALDGRLRALYTASLRAGTGAPWAPGEVGRDRITEARYTAVSIAVWNILNGGRKVSGSTYGTLRELWLEHFGYWPPIEMVPKMESR